MPDTPLDTLPEAIQLQLHIIGDGSLSTLEEAINQFEREHELVQELYQDFDVCRIVRVRLAQLLLKAEKIILHTNRDASMFLRQDTRDEIEEFAKELEKQKKLIPQLQEPPF